MHVAEAQGKRILEQLQSLGTFRPGSFIERYATCKNIGRFENFIDMFRMIHEGDRDEAIVMDVSPKHVI